MIVVSGLMKANWSSLNHCSVVSSLAGWFLPIMANASECVLDLT